MAFIPPGALAREVRRFPELEPLIRSQQTLARCRVWHAGRAGVAVDRPVRSDIPTLLLVGALDPIHPRPSSEAIARFLTAATVLEFPRLGHGTVTAYSCPRDLMRAFLADPGRALDAFCIAGCPGRSARGERR